MRIVRIMYDEMDEISFPMQLSAVTIGSRGPGFVHQAAI